MTARDGIKRRLDAAEAACAGDGARFTTLRRTVLELVLESQRPLGAYDVLALLKERRAGAAPPTVYRTLDFLAGHGLIHRVERLGAYVGCPEAGQHAHAVQLLICNSCGEVAEVEDSGVEDQLRMLAARTGFRPAHATVEVEGTCAGCAGDQGRETNSVT